MREKGLNIEVFNKKYFLIFKEEGLFFKSKEEEKDFFIPYEKIEDFDGVCLDDTYLLGLKYNYLYKMYAILFLVFILFSMNFSLSTMIMYFLFFLTIGFLLYKRLYNLLLIADSELILIKLDSNKKLCFILNKIKQTIPKRNLRQKIKTFFRYKVKRFKEDLFQFKNTIST